eukprot:scaffold1888_cov120-Cylindrotheca_fusiformis.AAC.2
MEMITLDSTGNAGRRAFLSKASWRGIWTNVRVCLPYTWATHRNLHQPTKSRDVKRGSLMHSFAPIVLSLLAEWPWSFRKLNAGAVLFRGLNKLVYVAVVSLPLHSTDGSGLLVSLS